MSNFSDLDTPTLLDQALTLARQQDEDKRWDAVSALHARGTREIFATCAQWCSSLDPIERELAADILGQLGGHGHKLPYRAETLSVLKPLLDDPEGSVIQAAIIALSHSEASDLIHARLDLAENPSADVRRAVASTIFPEETAPIIEMLVKLSRDEDGDVRDWATFGLGTQLEADTLELDALADRLHDADDGARGEAMVGLARRKDERLLLVLLAELASDNPLELAIEAAAELGSPRLVPALEKLQAIFGPDVALDLALESYRGLSRNSNDQGA